MTFIEYLKEKFMKATDVTWGEDDIESGFDDWAMCLDYKELIDYAEDWHERENGASQDPK